MKPATSFNPAKFPITTKNAEIKAYAEKFLAEQLVPVPEPIPKPADSILHPVYGGIITQDLYFVHKTLCLRCLFSTRRRRI